MVNEKKRLAQGFWPAINDTVLLVKSKNNSINLFADIDKEDYVFWSPYHNSSWNTIFFANRPFFQDTIKVKDYSSNRSEKYNQSLQQNAKRKGYEFASNYFIRIKKTDFNKTFENK